MERRRAFLFARGGAALATSFVHNFAPMMVATSVCGVRGDTAPIALRIRAENWFFVLFFFFEFIFFMNFRAQSGGQR